MTITDIIAINTEELGSDQLDFIMMLMLSVQLRTVKLSRHGRYRSSRWSNK